MKNIKTKKIVSILRSFAMISMCMGITILASCTTEETPFANTLAPVLAGCPENTDLGVITDIDAAIAGFVTALTATDDSGRTLPVAPDQELSSITTDGPFTITYTASDAAGNESNSCTFTGTLETTSQVLAGCPADASERATFFNDADEALAEISNITNNPPTSSVGTVELTSTPLVIPTTLTEGVTTLTYTVTGQSSADATCVFTVTLDTTPPVLTCSGNVATIYVNADDVGADTRENRIAAVMAVATDVEVTDDNPATPAVESVTSIDNIPGIESDGTFMVSYRAIADLAGNVPSVATCEFMVTVDTIIPVLEGCPMDENRALGPVKDIEAAIMTALEGNELTATDGSESPSVTPNVAPSSITEDGSFTITYTASDAAGNEATCIFTGIRDTIGPALICSGNTETIYVNAAAIETDTLQNRIAAVTAAAADVEVTEENPATPAVVPVTDVAQISGIDSDGTFMVSYNAAADLAGNDPSSSPCMFTVTVDTIVPMLFSCPTTQEARNLGLVNNIATAIATPVASLSAVDGSAPLDDSMILPDIDPSSITEDGDFTIIYAASDAAGNVSNSCVFKGTLDATPPRFTNCPESDEDRNLGPVNSISDTEIQNAVFGGESLNALDNSVSINRNLIDKKMAPNPIVEGSFTITYSVSDAAKNEDTCIVTGILDTTPPTINCSPVPTIIYVNAADLANIGEDTPANRLAAVTAVVDRLGLVTDENPASPSVELPEGSLTSLTMSEGADGEHNSIIYEAIADLAGNSPAGFRVCSEISITIDTMVPSLNCPAGTTALGMTGNIDAAITAEIGGPLMVTDASTFESTPMLMSMPDPSSITEGVPFSITYTAEDTAGNMAESCTFTGTLDTMPPEFDANTCPDDSDNRVTFFKTEMDALADITRITDDPPTSSDSTVVGGVMRDPVDLPMSLSEEGITTIKYSIADEAGNTVNCNFRVIYDMTAPTLGSNTIVVPCMIGNTGRATTSDSSSMTVQFSEVKFGVNTLSSGFTTAVIDNIPDFDITFDLSIQSNDGGTPILIPDLANTTLEIEVGEYTATVNATDAAKNTASSICSFGIEIKQGT